MYTVGQVAELAGVTVRTLHHYDEIGLVSPAGRTAAGYRMYADGDVERLARVLYYRELGFPLEQIAALMTEADASAQMREQHRLLRERLDRVTAMLAALEKEMEAAGMGISLTPQERLEIFGDQPWDDYDREAEDSWGDTEPWRQSQRRTARYTKDDWLAIKSEAAANLNAFADAFRSGAPVDSTEAATAAEAHRGHITRWFYDCSYEIHTGLAQLYLADDRFRKNYDDVEAGLAQYVHDAIQANAARR